MVAISTLPRAIRASSSVSREADVVDQCGDALGFRSAERASLMSNRGSMAHDRMVSDALLGGGVMQLYQHRPDRRRRRWTRIEHTVAKLLSAIDGIES